MAIINVCTTQDALKSFTIEITLKMQSVSSLETAQTDRVYYRNSFAVLKGFPEEMWLS